MFMGTSYNSIDGKNRMIVPSKMRADLGARCVITKGLDRCLYIYAVSDWEGQMEKISKLREKYDLHMTVERYVSDENGIPETDRHFIKK